MRNPVDVSYPRWGEPGEKEIVLIRMIVFLLVFIFMYIHNKKYKYV